MKKRIVLCADDYGQTPEISAGIVDLIEKGRLSATSCMTNSSYWRKHAPWLAPFSSRVDVGLHFNLTEGQPLSDQFKFKYGLEFKPLPILLSKAYFRQLDQALIEIELNHQLDAFLTAFGRSPDFIDGHQHVHQFPVIRDALMRVYQQRLQAQKVFIRSTISHISFTRLIFNHKQSIINLTGAKGLKNLLIKQQIPHNQSFAGVYRFIQAQTYSRLFPQFLNEINDKGLVMCHPALSMGETTDKIAYARVFEYQYLTSRLFLSDCEQNNIAVQRFQFNH